MTRGGKQSFEDVWARSTALRLAATFLVVAPLYAFLFVYDPEWSVAGWLVASLVYAAVMLLHSFSRVTGERWVRDFAETFTAMFWPFVWGGVVALVYLFLLATAWARLIGAAPFSTR